jgi:monoamine oxidase
MKTELANRLARTIRAAQWAESQGVPSDEAVAGFELTRRRFLGSMAAVAAVATVAPARRSWAAPAPNRAEIAIIGAGFAGLACAYELQRLRYSPHLYDANDRVGGRCFSLRGVFPGQVAERGGEFLDNLHKVLLGYVNGFGLTREDRDKLEGEVFYRVNGVNYPESRVVDELRAFVPRMQDDLRLSTGAPTADFHNDYDIVLDNTSLAEYLTTRGAGPVIGPIVEAAYIGEYGREISEQSSLNFLLFIHADRRAKFTPFGVYSDERFHVVEGNDAIATGINDRLNRKAELGVKLLAARRSSSNGRVTLTLTRGGSPFEKSFDAVVLATPFTTLRDVDLSGLDLPDWKTYAIDNLQYGTNAKLLVGFNQPFWRSLGANGDSYVSGAPSLQGTWETNWSKAGPSGAVLTDYTGGNLGAGLNSGTVDSQVGKFLADLEPVFPGATANATKVKGKYRADRYHWPTQPLWQGSYTCNQPGYFTTMAGNEGKAVDNVFFAGEHTDSFYSWQGFMEGAAVSGLTAAGGVAGIV